MIKRLALLFCVLAGPPVLGQSSLVIGAKGVYGLYRNSIVNNFLSERIDLFYTNKTKNWGAGLSWRRNDTSFEDDIVSASYYHHLLVSVYKSFIFKRHGSFTIQADGNFVVSNDANVDSKIPLYLSLNWLSSLRKHFVNFNLHYFPSELTNKWEFSSTYGVALFNYYIWLQAAAHYSVYTDRVQNLIEGWSINPEITYYIIPNKVTLTGYGIFGEQVFSYNPGTQLLYMSNILLKTNLGVTAYYQVNTDFKPYVDLQLERYEDRDFDQSFSATYFTVGLFYGF